MDFAFLQHSLLPCFSCYSPSVLPIFPGLPANSQLTRPNPLLLLFLQKASWSTLWRGPGPVKGLAKCPSLLSCVLPSSLETKANRPRMNQNNSEMRNDAKRQKKKSNFWSPISEVLKQANLCGVWIAVCMHGSTHGISPHSTHCFGQLSHDFHIVLYNSFKNHLITVIIPGIKRKSLFIQSGAVYVY